MKTTFFSTERSLMLIILAIVIYNMLTRGCSERISEVIKTPSVTIVRDTVWQTKTDTFKVQTLKYKTVYVDRNNISSLSETLPNKTETPATIVEAKLYKDTLRSNDIDIFSSSLVEGQLLNSEIS